MTEERIWSDTEVFRLNAEQHKKHGYTCGNNSSHRPLIATPCGWKCADCGYTQDWCHRSKQEPLDPNSFSVHRDSIGGQRTRYMPVSETIPELVESLLQDSKTARVTVVRNPGA